MAVLSNKETMVFPVNRRSFLYRAAVGAGAVLLWNGCVGALSTQNRDTVKEIKAIWEKEPSDPADVDRLKEIMLPWRGEENTEIVVEAARALALHASFFVIPIYKELFVKWYKNSKFVQYFIPLLALNFNVNPAARLQITYFLYRIAVQIAPGASLRPVYLSDEAKEHANSAAQFLGNVSLRGWYHKLHNAMMAHSSSKTTITAFLEHIQAIEPSFIAQSFPQEDTSSLLAQLTAGNDKDKISALRKLHKASFVDAQLLLSMLKNASYELEEAIIPLIGNNLAFTPEIEDIMLNYLDGNNNNLVIAAAKALRFKENLPAKKIVKILERNRKKNPILGQQLDDILLSTLVSEDAALADVFAALVWNMFISEPNNKKDEMKRINEIRIWYWRLSLNRKDHGYSYGISSDMPILEYRSDISYERNNRNDRVRIAIPSVPSEIQDLFIAFLRQIPAIAGPSENYYDDRLARDLKELKKIYEELRLKGDSIHFRK